MNRCVRIYFSHVATDGLGQRLLTVSPGLYEFPPANLDGASEPLTLELETSYRVGALSGMHRGR